MKAKSYCKYGHLKTGDNLLLRPRHIVGARTYPSGNTYPFDRTYVERVCRECLARQKREYNERQRARSNYSDAVRKQELAESRLEK